MKLIWSFVAGFLSTLVFHQGLVFLLYAAGLIPFAPFDLSPTKPLGIPSVISLAFFGGLWGGLIWLLVGQKTGPKKLLQSVILGAIGPTFVALAIVFPLKGLGFQFIFIPFGLILNAAWGFGLWLIMRTQKF